MKVCVERSNRPNVTGFGGVGKDLGFSVCVGLIAGEAEKAIRATFSRVFVLFLFDLILTTRWVYKRRFNKRSFES